MIYFIFSISAIYFILILSFIIGFYKSEAFEKLDLLPKNKFSIVIPFRNEAENLHALLNSLQQLNYTNQLFEILLVNDASEDEYYYIIENFKTKFPSLKIVLLENERKSNTPKKDAINTAISIANFEWIITTDADCTVPMNWLQLFNEFIETKKPVFISAPVKFKEVNTLLFDFQNMNFLSLIGSTIGSFGIKKPFMCNGANLCYQKKAFKTVNGFEGNTSIASGDDVFLLEKMVKQFPNQVLFLKSMEATVATLAEKSWKLYFNQQIRWASKATSYKSSFAKMVGISVLFINVILILLPILAVKNSIYWNYLLVIFLIKITIDFVLIQKTSEFLQYQKSLKSYLFIAVFQPILTISIGILSFFKGYQWKGRKFNK